MELYIHIIPFAIAAVAVFVIHPTLVKIALLKQIVDKPDYRKLNKRPIPVLGGVAVFFGYIFALGVAGYFVQNMDVSFELIIAMIIMLYTGVADDILQLSPRLRFVIQIFTVCLMMFLCGIYIDDFHGLWGIDKLPWWLAVGLTLLSCVGIINSINLIDGVDGLCSGYGVFVSLLFALFFIKLGDESYSVMGFALAGALFPFMLFNMFGRRSKMFLGDGGSLMLGFNFAMFVMRAIQSCDEMIPGYVISFSLAVLTVPVFDTVRVMVARILANRSPFQADKTHLHHMFIRLGFSHVITAVIMILLNALVVLVWVLCSLFSLSAETMLYVTALAGVLVTSGLYYTVEGLAKSNPEVYEQIKNFIKRHPIRRKGLLLKVQNILDERSFTNS